MYRRRRRNRNLVTSAHLYGVIPSMAKMMKYVYNGGALRSISWQYRDGHADFEFGDVVVYGMSAIGNANFRQFIQNQYAMFIINKVEFYLNGLEINRYYDIGKLEKVNGRYSDLRVDPLFVQDSVLISTYFVNNHGSFGQPLIGVAYEGVNRYRLKNGLYIKHTYYPRNKIRIETGELNRITEINKL